MWAMIGSEKNYNNKRHLEEARETTSVFCARFELYIFLIVFSFKGEQTGWEKWTKVRARNGLLNPFWPIMDRLIGG